MGSERTVETIQRELEFLAKRHSHLLALGEDETDTKKNAKERKKILEARHASREFHGNYELQATESDGDEYYLALFDEFARTVCHTAMIPRKELFECWAMALYVHYHFPPSSEDDETSTAGRRRYFKRVADMGCGQGLVSWAILFLDKSQTRTAIGIDRKIPKATDVIEQVIKERHPGVAEFQEEELPKETQEEEKSKEERHKRRGPFKRWHWVEGDICQNISADSSTLIVGVHCCGTLSDTILDIAIASRSPLALVPCCHTKKSLPKQYHNNNEKIKKLLADDAKKQQMLRNEIGEGDADEQGDPPSTSLTDYIDRCRIQKLIDAGYDVEEERIPSVITPKNRIIVATPPPPENVLEEVTEPTITKGEASSSSSTTTTTTTTTSDSSKAAKDDRYLKPKKVFKIPLADTPSAKNTVAAQSGRLAADLRQRKSPPNLSLSLFFSDPESITPQKLNEFSSAIALQEQHKYYHDACAAGTSATPIIITSVKHGTKGPFFNTETGNFSRSFHICYQVNDPTGKLPQITKAQAKELHKVVCQRIDNNAIPGIALRMGIRT